MNKNPDSIRNNQGKQQQPLRNSYEQLAPRARVPSRRFPTSLLAGLACFGAAAFLTLWGLRPVPEVGKTPEEVPPAEAAPLIADAGEPPKGDLGQIGEPRVETLAGALETAGAPLTASAATVPESEKMEFAPDPAFQQQVSEALARAYGGGSTTSSPSAGTEVISGAPTHTGRMASHSGAAAALRGYVQTERARRALVQEMRGIRRAAIAAANSPATNR